MLGDKIKQIRKTKNISQREFAKILAIPVSTLANYENNHRQPNIETLNKISEALGVSITELIEWDNLNEDETHKAIAKILAPYNKNEERSLQLQSKISYALHDIINFAEKTYNVRLFENIYLEKENTYTSDSEYIELHDNVTLIIQNKIDKLIKDKFNAEK